MTEIRISYADGSTTITSVDEGCDWLIRNNTLWIDDGADGEWIGLLGARRIEFSEGK